MSLHKSLCLAQRKQSGSSVHLNDLKATGVVGVIGVVGVVGMYHKYSRID
jgi:hypothetical protein